jgi:hypothetical protein
MDLNYGPDWHLAATLGSGEVPPGTEIGAAVMTARPVCDEPPSILTRHHYEVALVEPADLSGERVGADSQWHRYVLASGPSCITGFHRGSLEEVTAYAAGCAAAFNERNLTGKSARASGGNPKK